MTEVALRSAPRVSERAGGCRFGVLLVFWIQINLGLNGHTRAQFIEVPLIGVQTDSDRQALDDFHVIARGVFGWKKTGPISGRGRHVLYLAFEWFAEGIDLCRNALADVHATELGLLEVGGGPNILRLHDDHKLLPRRDSAADFGGSPGSDAIDGRNDMAIAQVEERDVQLRFCGRRVGCAR